MQVFDQTEIFREWTSLTKMSGKVAAMIQFLAMNYCLMKQMPTLRHLGEQSNHALGLAGIRPEG
jgi:hypothetical protein